MKELNCILALGQDGEEGKGLEGSSIFHSRLHLSLNGCKIKTKQQLTLNFLSLT